MFGFLSRKKGQVAHMGEENTMYYNEELKRWVERGKEHEAAEDLLPPPPPASSVATATQKTVDEGNPASRYVAAGGFSRGPTQPTETTKPAFMTPPKLTTVAPQTGDFFIPATVQKQEAAQETVESPQGTSVKYKGYRIPKFTKPEGVEGTQEEYEAEELRKFKARIDKKEARKKNDGFQESSSPKMENGIAHDRPKAGSGKLDDSWLTENGGEGAFGSQPFSSTEPFNTQQGVDQAFGLEPYSLHHFGDGAANEGATVELFPVESNGHQETGHMFSQPITAMDPTTLHAYPTENPASEWLQTGPQVTQEILPDEEPVNFDEWVEAGVEDAFNQTQKILTNSALNVTPIETQEDPYVEEFPGAVRSSDDPYDIAWLTKQGFSDPEQCRALTVWMCENYQDSWRTWHKSEPFWENFWTWYYDEGFDIIQPASQLENGLMNGTSASNLPVREDAAAAAFFNTATEEETALVEQTEGHLGMESQQRVSLPYDFEPTVPLSPKSDPGETVKEEEIELANRQEEAVPLEEFVPENDEDIWKAPDEEQEEPSVDVGQQRTVESTQSTTVTTTERAMEHVPLNEGLITCPVSTGKGSTTKLPPWEDEFLFSLPDPWMETPSSEEGTDDGNLPFAVFNHEGMLRFLQKLNTFLDDVSGKGSSDISTSTSLFKKQVKDLIKMVETSGRTVQGTRQPPDDESESLRRELEQKAHEVESLKRQVQGMSLAWSNKVQTTEKQNVELRETVHSMSQSLKEQQEKLVVLAANLRQTESDVDLNKQDLTDLMSKLTEKDRELEDLREDVISKKREVEALQCQLTKAEEGKDVIRGEVFEETESLRKEVQSLREDAARSKTPPLNPLAVEETQTQRESQAELRNEVMVLKKKLLQQKRVLDEKDEEIAQLLASDPGNGFSANNNELSTDDELMERLKEKETENTGLQRSLQLKESKIADLETEIRQQSAELESLKQTNHHPCSNPDLESESELTLKLEAKERQVVRLEQSVQDMDADIVRLTALIESIPKKDNLISKLTSVIGEKDQELVHLRSLIQEGRQREFNLIEQLTSKDDDLENVVHSLMFSQKQVAQLCNYCIEIGGDPHPVLSSLQVAE